ncbi:hypothetical protein ACJ73_02101 [Blastomyces percursus]|uniref:Uncharacterized protein n=1 Tax=Blastomyces percursus TaxID=1658174 RepID=A0A1J9QDI0_9EURO|nr:hypothetical protein ACJ73_02101 [Blastomyces percursus]
MTEKRICSVDGLRGPPTEVIFFSYATANECHLLASMLAFILSKFRPQNNRESSLRRAFLNSTMMVPFGGETIYECFGNRVIKSHNIPDGRSVAIKFKVVDFFWPSEADMMARFTRQPTLDEQQRRSIKEQLANHLKLFRSCTQPCIGRINRQPTHNPYEGIGTKFMGPFDSEAGFDEWCLSRIKNSFEKNKWRALAQLRRNGP